MEAACRFPIGTVDRAYKIMTLKLLALAQTSRPLSSELANRIVSLYGGALAGQLHS